MPISGSPITANSPVSLPLSADYTADRTGDPEKVFLNQVTKNGPIALPVAAYDTSTNIIEQRDTVFTINTAIRLGYRDFTRVGGGADPDTDGKDTVTANGITGGTTPYSNAWFNATWFSDTWFNATWFNSVVIYTGNADITEDGDDVSATGTVKMSGDANITEAHDWTDTYGSVGNDVRGHGAVVEDRDSVSAHGDVTIHATATIIEGRDTVLATGSGDVVRVLLSWDIVGGMTQVDVYRSDDNVTFTKIETLGGAATTYIDEDVVLGKTYYYYLMGKKTTGADTDPSDTESITTPN